MNEESDIKSDRWKRREKKLMDIDKTEWEKQVRAFALGRKQAFREVRNWLLNSNNLKQEGMFIRLDEKKFCNWIEMKLKEE